MKLAVSMLICFAFAGCRPATVADAKRAMSGDRYVRELELGAFRVEARMLPEALVYLTYGGLDGGAAFKQRVMDSLKAEGHAGYGLMFVLTLSPSVDTLLPTDYRNDIVFGQAGGEKGYREVLEHFQSGLSAKIWLEAEGNRYPLRSYHMTNSWGMSKSRTFTLIFDSVEKVLPERSGTVDLVVEDILPGQGRDRLGWKLPIHPYDFI